MSCLVMLITGTWQISPRKIAPNPNPRGNLLGCWGGGGGQSSGGNFPVTLTINNIFKVDNGIHLLRNVNQIKRHVAA